MLSPQEPEQEPKRIAIRFNGRRANVALLQQMRLKEPL